MTIFVNLRLFCRASSLNANKSGLLLSVSRTASDASKPPNEPAEQNAHREKDSSALIEDDGVIRSIPKVYQPKPVVQSVMKRIRVDYHGVEASQFNDDTIWTPIYRFPYLTAARTIVRYKFYATTILSLAFANKFYNFFVDLNTIGMVSTMIIAAASYSGIWVIGNTSRRFIVQIYVSDDLEFIRFVRLTSFGRRQDFVLPRSLVVPLSEINVTPRSLMLNQKFKMPTDIDMSYDFYEFYDQTFKVSLKYGGVLDRDKFRELFGRILERVHEL